MDSFEADIYDAEFLLRSIGCMPTTALKVIGSDVGLRPPAGKKL